MWKFLFALLVFCTSTAFISADQPESYTENFPKICVSSDVLTSVTQNCDVLRNCENSITLDLENFSKISQFAFGPVASFTEVSFISHENECNPKIIEVTPNTFYGLSSLEILKLDCVKFIPARNPFQRLKTIIELHLSRMEFSEDFLTFRRLTRLSISKVNITSITPDTFSQISRKLQHLHLAYNNLQVLEGKSFQQFRNLRSLSITYNQLSDLDPEMFSDLKNLNLLVLTGNNISELRRNTFTSLTRLQTLDVEHNKIREIEIGAFSNLPIKALYLAHNELENVPAGAFKNLKNLNLLSLRSNKISTVRINDFEGLGEVYLDLSGNNIHRIEQSAFLGLRLFLLDLSHNKLKVLKRGSFDGLHITGNLDLTSNQLTVVKRDGFKNLTCERILIQCNYITEIYREVWGVDADVWKVYIDRK